MITKEMAFATTRQGKIATIVRAIAEIDHEITRAAQQGYDGLSTYLHVRKLDKTERRTIKFYYEILGYTKVRVGKRSINLDWGE